MSKATATRNIKFISKAGTYTAQIMSPSGDLYQEYTGTQSKPENIFPNFAITKPILYFICTSSRSTESLVKPDGMSYYFNNQHIIFGDNNISTGVYDGYFKRIFPGTDGKQPYFGIQILKDLAPLAGFVSCVIKMVANVSYGNITDSIQASYTVSIGKSEGTGYRVTIAAGDTKNFVIKESTGSCILKAVVSSGGAPIKGSVAYKWYKLTKDGWQIISSATSQQITIKASDIDVYGNYKVEALIGGSVVASDEQNVIDASDPDVIETNPTPKDETIFEEGGNDKVTYTPRVVRRGTSEVTYNGNFFFVVKSANGVILSKTGAAATKTYTVNRDMCVQAGGDVSITIFTEQ